jgi:hypothetical protein
MKKDIRCSLLLVLGLAMPAPLEAQPKVEAQPVRVARVSAFADQAAFLLYLNGSLILTNFVTWKENGAFEEKGEGIAEGDKIRMATTMSADSEGYWSEVWMQMLGLNLYTRFYDEAKGGKQVLPILIPHKKADEISLERKRRFQRMLAGKKLELREFELKTGDLTALVWIDEGGRLIKSEQPDEGSMFIRQGYEAARAEH